MGVPEPRCFILRHGNVKRPSSCMLCHQKRVLLSENDLTAVINEQASAHVEQIVKSRSQKKARHF